MEKWTTFLTSRKRKPEQEEVINIKNLFSGRKGKTYRKLGIFWLIKNLNKTNKIFKMNKKTILVSIAVLFAIFLIGSVLAVAQCSDGIDNDLDGKKDYPADDGCTSLSDYSESKFLGYADGCLVRGDRLYDIWGKLIYFCDHDQCPACIAMYETKNMTTDFSYCVGLPPCGFKGGGGGTVINQTFTFNLVSPLAGIFSSTSQLINLETNLPANIVMYDSFDSKTTTLCSDCYAYNRQRTFKDGRHDLTFTASKDAKFSVKEVSFLIDSKKPKIKKTLPKKGFASGLFNVEIQEKNPEKLELHYGNGVVGFRTQVVDLNTCEIIKGNSEKKACQVDVALEDYDAQTIEYWFYLEDIASSFVESKHLFLNVDTTFPKAIDNTNYNIIGKSVYFNISVDELNLDEVFYTYTDSRGMLKDKRLCSSLKEGNCIKKVSFALGNHDLTLNVIDKAGNLIAWPVSFNVV